MDLDFWNSFWSQSKHLMADLHITDLDIAGHVGKHLSYSWRNTVKFFYICLSCQTNVKFSQTLSWHNILIIWCKLSWYFRDVQFVPLLMNMQGSAGRNWNNEMCNPLIVHPSHTCVVWLLASIQLYSMASCCGPLQVACTTMTFFK